MADGDRGGHRRHARRPADRRGRRQDGRQQRAGLGRERRTLPLLRTLVRPHPPAARPAGPGVTYLTGDIGEAVATALDAAGGKDLEILGADVARQCLQRGLVGEILVYAVPVLLGDGIRFHSSTGHPRIDLEPLDSTRHGDVTVLRFRVKDASER